MLHPEHLPPKIEKSTDDNRKWLPLFLPWSGKLAHNSVISLKRCIPNDFAKITFAYSVTKLRTLLPSFSTTPENIPHNEHRFLFSHIVYKYTCSCSKVYIGETERRFSIRIQEHLTSKNSAIFEHQHECVDSSLLDRDKFTIVAKRLTHRDSRKRYESIYIRYYDKKANHSGSTMNNCKRSRELVIF